MPDKSSLWYSKAVDILFLKDPHNTALGIIFGVILHAVFSNSAPEYYEGLFIDLSKVALWQWLAVGVFILHSKYIFFPIKPLPKGVLETINVIREMRKDGVPEWQIQKQWRDLPQKFLDKHFEYLQSAKKDK